MKGRIFIGRFLVRLGGFIKSLAVVVMRPEDLIEFSLLSYARRKPIGTFSSDAFIESGLYPPEEKLVDNLKQKGGNLLILGVGGGREVLAFVRMGYLVTGADFLPELVAKAKENASRYGYEFKGDIQEFSRLDTGADRYDVVWLSYAMYSSISTREKRINMLRRIWKSLKTGGEFACQFYYDPFVRPKPVVENARKLVGYLSLGNSSYQTGDMILGGLQFIHAFKSEQEVREEFDQTAFRLCYLDLSSSRKRGEAILEKSCFE